jgi:Ca2+-binding RTX toxin-like protein
MLALIGLLSFGLLAGLVLDSAGSDDETDDETEGRLVEGTRAGDTLAGGNDADLIFGNPGPDELSAGSGDDVVAGGRGFDTLAGNRGDDLLFGGAARDQISGGAGDDILLGGDGHDLLRGNTGDDRLIGGAGYDTLAGGDGDDTIYGQDDGSDAEGLLGASFDTLVADRFGAVNPDLIERLFQESRSQGPLQSDQIYGGPGHDTIYSDSRDVVTGGAGNDMFAITAAPTLTTPAFIAPVITDFDMAADRLEIALAADAFNLPADMALVGADTHVIVHGQLMAVLQGVDAAAMDPALIAVTGGRAVVPVQTGGAGDDPLTGFEAPDTLAGGGGHDTLAGLGGADALFGGAGEDSLLGGAGADTLDGGFGDDWFFGGAGADLHDGGNGADYLETGGGNDTVFGGDGNDAITDGDRAEPGGDMVAYGGAGRDDIQTQFGGADLVDGGAGRDALWAGPRDTVSGGSGDDAFFAYVSGDEDAESGASLVRITDFVPGQETIRLMPMNTTEGGRYVLTLSDTPEGVLGRLSADISTADAGDVLLLEGLRLADLNLTDFVLEGSLINPVGEVRFA